jgi:biopolymer transport protein ExbB
MPSRILVHCLALISVLGTALFVESARADGPTPNVDSVRGDSITAILSPDLENRIAGTDSRVAQLRQFARMVVGPSLGWYRRTAPRERVAWGGIAACGGLALWVFAERLVRLRSRHVIPVDFASRFINSIHDGKLDCGQALDHCERNPSPAARVALAALRRWGRPSNDLERAVALATRVECDRLRRNVSTLRRVAALAPLIGLMGTLFAISAMLDAATTTPLPTGALNSPNLTPLTAKNAPISATALTPLIVGVAIAVLALVAYDGLFTRVEKLSGALERLGAETIDAIAMMTPRPASRPIHLIPHVPNPATEKSTSQIHLGSLPGSANPDLVQRKHKRKPR